MTPAGTGSGQHTGFGTLTVEPLRLAEHLALLHAWITHPRARFWGMGDATPARVRAAYRAIEENPHHHAWLGRLDGTPLFLTETYDPGHSELRAHYEVTDGDVGMHLLVAPPDAPRSGLTSEVMRTVMHFVFADPRHRRVVVEPDVRNHRIAAKNREAGFTVLRRVRLTDKTAHLCVCTRADFANSPLGRRTP